MLYVKYEKNRLLGFRGDAFGSGELIMMIDPLITINKMLATTMHYNDKTFQQKISLQLKLMTYAAIA